MAQFVFSKVKYFEEYLNRWDSTLDSDFQNKDVIEGFIKQLESPFGFFEVLRVEFGDGLEDEGADGTDPNLAGAVNAIKKADLILSEKEKTLVVSVDKIATIVANKLGFPHVPWFTLTLYVIAIQTALTILSLFFRKDFLNLTVCVCSIYVLNNAKKIKRWTFRVLVFGIFLSVFYDLIWLLLFNDINNDLEDGGV
jgi:hypothetical protein